MIEYKANDPKGWGGDPKRGAALGRPSRKGDANHAGTILVREVQVSEDGYDTLGTYWGKGTPLYWYASEDGSIEGTERAPCASDALAAVAQLYPRATVRADFVPDEAIDDFLESYIEAALWITTAEDAGGDPEKGEHLDAEFTVDALTPESRQAARADCLSFMNEARPLIGADVAHAGFCLWLDRNGHGSGFWDDTRWSESVRGALHEAAQKMGQASIYVGDDGHLYYEGRATWRDFAVERD